MTLRASLVLLVVLNLGVALWWVLHSDAPPVPAEEAPSGIARLQLLSERPELQPAPAPIAASTNTPTSAPPVPAPPPPAPAAPERCYSAGPFADTAALDAARAALAPMATRVRSRELQEGGGRGWRVYLPAAADREAADANAQRLRAAGFSDLVVVGDGAEANSVALGRFSTEARARAHAGALQAAGFGAKAEALGESRSRYWLDLVAGPGFDQNRARRAAGIPVRSTDCAGLR
ncbi:MAG: SPOR domain-containing protein [Lysobacter sp.]|nr:SPOR domain-containing protein [Lysobacter sp.]